MLGILKMSVEDCILAYTSMMDPIFKRGLPLDWRGRVKGKFDTAELEAQIRKLVKKHLGSEDASMRTRGSTPDCKVSGFMTWLYNRARLTHALQIRVHYAWRCKDANVSDQLSATI